MNILSFSLLFLLFLLQNQIYVVNGGQCVFTQNCLHDQNDGPCYSTLSNHTSFNVTENVKGTLQKTYWDGKIGTSLTDCGSVYVDFEQETGKCK